MLAALPAARADDAEVATLRAALAAEGCAPQAKELELLQATTAVELNTLRAENALLRRDLEKAVFALKGARQVMEEHHIEFRLTPTTPVPMHDLGSQKIPEDTYEVFVLGGVVSFAVLLFLCPFAKPCKRFCETRLHRVCPVIAVLNFCLVAGTLDYMDMVDFNEIFFFVVKVVAIAIASCQTVVVGGAVLVGLFVVWKFKDRILETVGLESGTLVVGDFRDWATCWSMRRFRAIEIFILKADSLPATTFSSGSDLFVEVALGYNMNMRTRVHHGAGQTCVFKESLQVNFDPYDCDSRLNLSVKSQSSLGNDTVSQAQLGAAQVVRLQEGLSGGAQPELLGWETSADMRSQGSAWSAARFHAIELVPAGRLYVRIVPVPEDDSTSCCWCCPTLFGSSRRY